MRANKIWQQVVKAYQKPPMDEAVQEALEAFVVRRTAELEGVELYD